MRNAWNNLKYIVSRVFQNVSEAQPSQKTNETKNIHPPRNSDPDLLATEFSKRFLLSIVRHESASMQGEEMSFPGPGVVKATAVSMPVVLAVGALGGPPAALAASFAVGIRVVYVLLNTSTAYGVAGEEVANAIKEGNPQSIQKINKWLTKNRDKLPEYLNRLDRLEENHRRTTRLVNRINATGNIQGITESDRIFLRKQGYKRLKQGMLAPILPPAPYVLSIWTQSQLSRVIWGAISQQAGPKASVVRGMLFLPRPAPSTQIRPPTLIN